MGDPVEAAAIVAYRRSMDTAVGVRPSNERDWVDIADQKTRDYFRDLVRPVVNAARGALREEWRREKGLTLTEEEIDTVLGWLESCEGEWNDPLDHVEISARDKLRAARDRG